MGVKLEFSRRAGTYDQYNIIQRQVAESLVEMVADSAPKTVCDLGCGSGTVYRKICWPLEKYVAVDFSREMCALHPAGEVVSVIQCDFNEISCFRKVEEEGPYDRVFSSSALQWADDLDLLLGRVVALESPVALAVFTGNTFGTLLESAGLASPIRLPEELDRLAMKHFGRTWSYRQYSLTFEDRLEMFRYIKKSGVSGGKRRLNFSDARRMLREYPLDSLEFEVGFLVT